MIFNIIFEKTDKVIDFNNQHQMNGFIFTMLGEMAEKYHNAYSGYSVSSIQGGRMSPCKKGLVFDESPFVQISSNDNSVIGDFVNCALNAIDKKTANFFGLYPVRIEGPYIFNCCTNYDVVRTMSPILVKKDGVKLTCNDDGWVDALTDNCVKKLKHSDIVDDTFRIVVGNKDNIHSKIVMVGEVFNPCTEGVFMVYGKRSTREVLYNSGLGNSTGSGFGAIRILKKNR